MLRGGDQDAGEGKGVEVANKQGRRRRRGKKRDGISRRR